MRTLKGCWVSINTFVTEDDKVVHVAPYGMTANLIKPQLPLNCYILLDGSTVRNWLIINKQTK